MKQERYDSVKTASDLNFFDFSSIGKNGTIFKRICFIYVQPDVYMLVMGNVGENGEIDDLSISDNGDRNKILATVVDAINLYTARYPTRMIYFLGSTPARTRLYRMVVGLHLEELSITFEIYAEVDKEENFVPFHKNMEVNAFLIKRRTTSVILA